MEFIILSSVHKFFNVKDIISPLAGAGLVFAFAPFHYGFLAWFIPAILLAVCIDEKAWIAFRRGLLFGLGFFGVGVSWVYVSIHTFGQTSFLLAVVLTFLFICVLALFIALMSGLLCQWVSPKYRTLFFPLFWTLSELAKTYAFTGFPWLFLAYSQVDTPLSGWIPIVGETGATFLIVVLNSLVFLLYRYRFKVWPPYVLGALIFIGGFVFSNIEWTQKDKAITVSLVQGNIPQSLKWDPLEFSHHLNRYLLLTEKVWSSSLVIWPENGIPSFPQSIPDEMHLIQSIAKDHHSTLLTGIPWGNPEGQYYNAILALGQNQGLYLKRHLVPFGEYVPFDFLLRGLINFLNLPMSSFQVGPSNHSLIQIQGINISTLICYEIAFEHLLKKDLPEAQLIVVVSDDAWFGHSFAPAQHLQIAQFRALESGRPLLFSTNDGITAVIDSKGQLIQTLPPFEEGVLTTQVVTRKGQTPWERFF